VLNIFMTQLHRSLVSFVVTIGFQFVSEYGLNFSRCRSCAIRFMCAVSTVRRLNDDDPPGVGGVSYSRMTRPDASQGEIVAALRHACVTVWIIGRPCDLLTFYRGRWLPLECKPEGHKRPRRDQETQSEFLAIYAVPVVRTAIEALEAVGAI
jgi:hypothetical protein